MDRLREIPDVRQIPGESPRRWFTSTDADFVVWLDASGRPLGFQFCYDKGGGETAITWRRDTGFTQARVDDGESRALACKATPLLLGNTSGPDLRRALERFSALADDLPERYAHEFTWRLLAGEARRHRGVRRSAATGRRRRKSRRRA
ncbi:MAG: hypothetical protein GC151_15425 [Betaproteobacteria bacterium]|nr:hypothetical protein [Betaproteobacteria bacterium]